MNEISKIGGIPIVVSQYAKPGTMRLVDNVIITDSMETVKKSLIPISLIK